MDKIDRLKQPPFSIPKRLSPVQLSMQTFDSGIPVYLIKSGLEPITRIDFIFQAGTIHQDKLFSASSCSSLLTEGTQSKTGTDIAENLDFMGSYAQGFYDREEAGMHLYALNKFVEPTLDLVIEMITQPSFTQKDLNIYRQKKIQNLQIDQQRVETRARQRFFQSLFGPDHPYGQFGSIQDVESLKQADVFDFHQKHYTKDTLALIITGPNPNQYLDALAQGIQRIDRSIKNKLQVLVGESITSNDSLDYVEVENATQVALRMGRSIPNRTHPDHFKLSFTNVVLGGYFGSRLMQNIREDKGFTYGIGSNSVHFKQAGFLTISCNIKADCLEQTIEECYKEMRLLAKDLIPEGEFVRVKNYLIGDIQRQMDGPFALADTFKSLLFHQEDFNYIHQMIEAIHKITRRDIADMAAKYLEPLDYICIAAGPAKK